MDKLDFNGIKFGFHLSIAGNISNAPKEALSMGYGTFQIFVSNPRSWNVKAIDENSALEFKKIAHAFKKNIFAHAPYLANPSSTKIEILKKSIDLLKGNIDNCSMLGIPYLVVHIGSHLGSGYRAGINSILKSIPNVLDNTDNNVTILLENSSGYKNSMGSKINEIAEILENINSERVGVCIDTCHAFAAGYDIRTHDGMNLFMSEIDNGFGFEKIKLIHLNDAKFDCNSGLDRHWHIGLGKIGAEGFSNFFKMNKIKSKCFVMELPIDEYGDNNKNLTTIKSIIHSIKN